MKYIISQEEIDTIFLEEIDGEEISKSQRKRNIQVLHKLGGALCQLSTKNLKKIPLDEDVLEGLLSAQKMQSDNARKRQFQYIAKLLHQTNNIQEVFDSYIQTTQPGEKNKKEFMLLERLRDKIIDHGDEAISDVLGLYPNADRQMLRQFIRNIQKEKKLEKPPAQQRKLFKYLRELQQI